MSCLGRLFASEQERVGSRRHAGRPICLSRRTPLLPAHLAAVIPPPSCTRRPPWPPPAALLGRAHPRRATYGRRGPEVLPLPPAAATMKIEKANAGYLTNFEVLDFLRTRGAKTDPMGCLGAVAASECKVYEFLLKTPASKQTRESVTEFANRCEGFKLTAAEKQNIINWRPSSIPDVYSMVEECEKRFAKDEQGGLSTAEERAQKRAAELLNLVNEVFPPAPTEPEDEVMKDA